MMQIYNKEKKEWHDCSLPKLKTQKEYESIMIAERFHKMYAEDTEWYYYQTDYRKSDSTLYRIRKKNCKNCGIGL